MSAIVVLARLNLASPGTATAPVTGAAQDARALLPPTAVPVAIEDSGTVWETYRRVRPSYLGELTVWLACVGRGRITLVVSGTEQAGNGSGAQRELTRVSARCDGRAAFEAKFIGDQFLSDFVFDLVDAGSATGQAGFAYQITSDTITPITVTDFNRTDLARVLRLSGDGDHSLGGVILPDGPSDAGTLPKRGSYTAAVACVGLGQLDLRIGDRVAKVECSYSPRRHDTVVAWRSGGAPRVTAELRSNSKAPARWTMHLLPR